jgi:hypothetical protein
VLSLPRTRKTKTRTERQERKEKEEEEEEEEVSTVHTHPVSLLDRGPQVFVLGVEGVVGNHQPVPVSTLHVRFRFVLALVARHVHHLYFLLSPSSGGCLVCNLVERLEFWGEPEKRRQKRKNKLRRRASLILRRQGLTSDKADTTPRRNIAKHECRNRTMHQVAHFSC